MQNMAYDSVPPVHEVSQFSMGALLQVMRNRVELLIAHTYTIIMKGHLTCTFTASGVAGPSCQH